MHTWLWGRRGGTFGEVSFLKGQMAAAEVAALQIGHVIAMIEHFAGNNHDWDRVGHFPDFTGINEIISERTLHEIIGALPARRPKGPRFMLKSWHTVPVLALSKYLPGKRLQAIRLWTWSRYPSLGQGILRLSR